MSSFIIHSNKTVTPQGVKNTFIQIENGVIKHVFFDLPQNDDLPLIDIGDNVLMPGVVDPHVHINEPGRTDWEGFETATKAAIAGGVTTLVDMPLNSSPVTTTATAFNKKIEAAFDKIRMTSKLNCHCGFWGGIIPGNEKEIEPLIQKGVLGFKAFLTHSGIDEFPNVTEKDLRKVMPVIAKHQLPLLVHCEMSGPQSTNNDPRSYKNYVQSRPKKWEDDAIALMIRLCEEFSCRVHIVHLSSSNSIEQIKQAKEKGLPITVETAQHYLFFNEEEIEDGHTEYKCAPPIRDRENNDQLWLALEEGIIDFVATDHSPCPPQLKELSGGNFMQAWGGIASIQFALSSLWTAAKKRNCTLNDLAKWLCENPAKLIGKQASIGKIQKGYDADFIIWDPEKTFTVTESIIQHKHKITPYLNEELFGIVEEVFLKGSKVFEKNQYVQLNKGNVILNKPNS